jgi:virginiamycin B lyase
MSHLARATIVTLLCAAAAASGQVVDEFPISSGAKPLAIASGAGAIWFTLDGVNRLGRITPNGTVTELPLPRPGRSLVVGPDDNIWMTSYGYVSRVTPRGNVADFPINGYGYGIAVGPDRALWFLVHGFDDTTYLGRMTLDGRLTRLQVDGAGGSLVAGPDGNLWLPGELYFGRSQILRVTPGGEVTRFGDFGTASLSGVAVGADGRVWFTSLDGSFVGSVSTTGEVRLVEIAAPAQGIAAGPDGNLWLTFPLSRKVGRLSSGGELQEITLAQQGSRPSGICAAYDGRLWFTEAGAPRIGRIQPAATETFTIPAAASLQGARGVRFRSDLLLFNRSHKEADRATLTYRCLRSTPCEPRSRSVAVEPRQTLAFEDVVATLFGAPGTAGPIDVSLRGPASPIQVTSRVYATSEAGTFGTPVPALTSSAARPRWVLLGVAGGARYRSNAGVVNGAQASEVTLTLRDRDGAVLGTRTEGLEPFEALQLDDVFAAVGAVSVDVRDAVLAVSAGAGAPLFAYLAVIDNASGDSVLQTGAEGTSPRDGSVAGDWGGSFAAYDWDCELPAPANARFDQHGESVSGKLVTSAVICGFAEGFLSGTLRAGELSGYLEVTGARVLGNLPTRVSGRLDGDRLEIDLNPGCLSVECMPSGTLTLHRGGTNP